MSYVAGMVHVRVSYDYVVRSVSVYDMRTTMVTKSHWWLPKMTLSVRMSYVCGTHVVRQENYQKWKGSLDKHAVPGVWSCASPSCPKATFKWCTPVTQCSWRALCQGIQIRPSYCCGTVCRTQHLRMTYVQNQLRSYKSYDIRTADVLLPYRIRTTLIFWVNFVEIFWMGILKKSVHGRL